MKTFAVQTLAGETLVHADYWQVSAPYLLFFTRADGQIAAFGRSVWKSVQEKPQTEARRA